MSPITRFITAMISLLIGVIRLANAAALPADQATDGAEVTARTTGSADSLTMNLTASLIKSRYGLPSRFLLGGKLGSAWHYLVLNLTEC
ncbi:uncharacterized protein PAC_06013 [Phialocephala subalpina]|uniref:Uncharacterized protein n=1 Tax=Phialocephala subalpina TaxID=576137 RepID=A0A1L7WTL2_9HELO|nr:uncharacterized protein PAC_06013 [Phialocephala subalpina]